MKTFLYREYNIIDTYLILQDNSTKFKLEAQGGYLEMPQAGQRPLVQTNQKQNVLKTGLKQVINVCV